MEVFIVFDTEHYIQKVFDSMDKAETYVIQRNTEDEHTGDMWDYYYVEGRRVE